MTAPSISKHPKTINGILKAPVVSLKRPKRENIPLKNTVNTTNYTKRGMDCFSRPCIYNMMHDKNIDAVKSIVRYECTLNI